MFSNDKTGLLKCLINTLEPLDHLLWSRGISKKHTDMFFSRTEEMLAFSIETAKERPEAGICLFLGGALAYELRSGVWYLLGAKLRRRL